MNFHFPSVTRSTLEVKDKEMKLLLTYERILLINPRMRTSDNRLAADNADTKQNKTEEDTRLSLLRC